MLHISRILLFFFLFAQGMLYAQQSTKLISKTSEAFQKHPRVQSFGCVFKRILGITPQIVLVR